MFDPKLRIQNSLPSMNMSIITIIKFNNNDDHSIQYLAKVYSKISKDIGDKGFSNMEAVSMPFQSK